MYLIQYVIYYKFFYDIWFRNTLYPQGTIPYTFYYFHNNLIMFYCILYGEDNNQKFSMRLFTVCGKFKF